MPSEVVSVNLKGKRETEKHVLEVDAVAAGFNQDGSLVLDCIDPKGEKAIRVRISREDVESQRLVFADWARRRGS